jgi:DNA-binding response OmpR family regulator
MIPTRIAYNLSFTASDVSDLSMSIIAVVIGNPNLRSILAEQLQQQGHQVRQTAGMDTACQEISKLLPDLAIVDYDLADGSGTELCRWLRLHSNTLILMLSTRLTETEIITALEFADDYLKKPFGMKEFLARVAALLRRSRTNVLPSEIVHGDLRVDLVRGRVYCCNQAIDLTPQEFSLLYVLLQSNGQPVSREELLHRAWDENMGSSRTVDTHILSLRKKLQQPDWIVTVRHFGYQLTVPQLPGSSHSP